MTLPRQKQKRKIFLMLSLIILVFFSTITIFGDEGLLKLRKLYQLQEQIHKQNQELFTTNQTLSKSVTLLKDPVNTQRLIREKLGYLKKNEYVLFLDENSQPVVELHPSKKSSKE